MIRTSSTRRARDFSMAAAMAVLLLSAVPQHAIAQSLTQEPTGAGTKPDGVVDQPEEGLRNTTQTDTYIDSSAASDAVSPLLDVEDAGPEPASSAEGLTPPASDTPILKKIGVEGGGDTDNG